MSNNVRLVSTMPKIPAGGEQLAVGGVAPDLAEKYDESSPPELTVSKSGVGVGRLRGEPWYVAW